MDDAPPPPDADRGTWQYQAADVGLLVREVYRNPAVARLYEMAIARESSRITRAGALATNSGKRTGRSPKDKRVIEEPGSKDDVWWGDINMPRDDHTFLINRQRAVDFFNSRDYIYAIDGYAGWAPEHRLKVRVVCARAYHALFMHTMLIRPTRDELAAFGAPDLTIYNAGQFPANPLTAGVTGTTSIDLHFGRGELVILGTEYAGEMKKGVFTAMNYLLPKRGVLSMHCSANEGANGDVALFFGLSGTGKTTLSTDPRRRLIGDDEHGWSDSGVFNIEGGCYAKCHGLSPATEPEIYNAVRFGTVLENVVVDPETRSIDYNDISLTENTRAAYPLEFIPGAKLPAVGGHPNNIILLTCDAFGVLPPVSRLTPEQAMYHFLAGYTAKVAGTEQGVSAPTATFSACFGAAFMVWHPSKYAELLAERIRRHDVSVYLVNTGWTGGGAATGGRRMPLRTTRAVVDAIHAGALAQVPVEPDPFFGVGVPASCPGVDPQLLRPAAAWPDRAGYEAAARHVAGLFNRHFATAFGSTPLPPGVADAGPRGG